MATLPKPTTPQPSAGGDKTVFQNTVRQPQSPTTAPGVAPIKLGGKSIPVPGNKPAAPVVKPPLNPQVPKAPLPQAAAPAASKPSETSMGINPALAPKAVTPLAPPPAAKAAPAAGPTPLKTPFMKQPLFAQIQADPKRWLLILLGGLLGVFLLFFLLSRVFGGRPAPVQENGTPAPSEQVVLTYWGLWEPSAVLESVIADYETANPGVKIDYRVQSHKDYRERLQTAIASGNGPDIFRYHASWVPMLSSDLAVLPASVMSASEFQSTFYPVVSRQLQVDGKIVGLPMMYDGLALYYNKQILQTAGVEPPATWAELKQLATELTVPADENERQSSGIQRSGLAIGNASNVDHFSDILGLLILQNGGDPAAPNLTEVRDALTFYTNFVKEDTVWSSTLPSSTVAFARGDVAMMFAPSWRAHEVMELNPSLQFGIAPVPQLSEQTVAWANYWAEGVNEQSDKKTAAWSFLKYLSSSEVMQKLYSAQAQVRTFGEPYSRQDLAGELAEDPYVGAILKDAPNAQGWYMSSATHDNGLNDNIIGYYAAAVNGILAGEDLSQVLSTLNQGVTQELRQYNFGQANNPSGVLE